MFVKLSGDKWVNTGNVCSIEREERAVTKVVHTDKGPVDYIETGRVVYVVWFTGHENKMVLNETQGRELLASIPIQDGCEALYTHEREVGT